MRKLLARLTLAELRAECVRMELCQDGEKLTSMKKLELACLIKDFLLACGNDPTSFDFSVEAAEEPEVGPLTNPTYSTSSNLGVSQPPSFSLVGPRRGHRWAAWSDEFQTYVSLFGEFSPERKTALLLHCAGSEVKQWKKTLTVVPAEDEDQYSALLRAMNDAFSPVESILFERYRLGEIKQLVGEPLDDFATRLRVQARFCKLLCASCNAPCEEDALVASMIKNTTSSKFRQLVFEKRLSRLDEVLQLGRALESAEVHSQEMSKESVLASEYKGPKGTRRVGGKPNPQTPAKKPIKCKFCAGMHMPLKSQCKAYGKTCNKCGRMNHFASCCEMSNSVVSKVAELPHSGASKRLL
eukprot:TRINITY_DN6056_c0_g1_i2.p1 TRINITY_DN6056_c0_g1~~TRINITY_DN6056_c0_g1_i2.p1  ORF type:complete len:355 (-),score=42.54 TRINITY_DN6056_c0_g1_i2:1248-2312(-)